MLTQLTIGQIRSLPDRETSIANVPRLAHVLGAFLTVQRWQSKARSLPKHIEVVEEKHF